MYIPINYLRATAAKDGPGNCPMSNFLDLISDHQKYGKK
jgi:hypothetical protein